MIMVPDLGGAGGWRPLFFVVAEQTTQRDAVGRWRVMCSPVHIYSSHDGQVLMALPRFPELAEATAAEWWAHCRPHPVGHQLHFDSDDEGVGGARHPICSAVVYVDAAAGFGGPTLVTDQRLGDTSSAARVRGWLAHPRVGRLSVFDGSVLHGVVPGWGEAPSSSPPGARRVTWMVAFWRKIAERPFGPDGLAGSSRPLPDTSSTFVVGPRSYTWHKQLSLASASISPDDATSETLAQAEVPPLPLPAVWARVPGMSFAASAIPKRPSSRQPKRQRLDEKRAKHVVDAPQPPEAADVVLAEDEAMPAYGECFQW